MNVFNLNTSLVQRLIPFSPAFNAIHCPNLMELPKPQTRTATRAHVQQKKEKNESHSNSTSVSLRHIVSYRVLTITSALLWEVSTHLTGLTPRMLLVTAGAYVHVKTLRAYC